MGGVRIFDSLPDEALGSLLDAATEQELGTNETLIRTGDAPSDLFVVLHGRFSIRSGGEEVAQLGAREVIGELGLVDDRCVSADVVAIRSSAVLRISIATAREVLIEHPKAALAVSGVIANRLRDSSTSDRRAPRVLAIDAGQHTDALLEALADRCASSVVVDNATEIPEAEINNTVLVDATLPGVSADVTLSTQHANRGYGIRIGDVGPQSGFCIGVDPADPKSLDRLSRLVFGGGRVLALGGGGFRVLATLGLLLEFDQQGIEFDAFIGVSACSPAAVLLGAGVPVEEVVEQTMACGDALSLRRDFGLTSTSILNGKSLTDSMKRTCRGLQLHQLERPAMLGATRLSDRSAVPLVDGPAWRAVRASASIPIVFPPVQVDGSLFVDGGVADNLPTRFAYERFADPHVTAVSVGSESSIEIDGADFDGVAKRSVRDGGAKIMDVILNCLRGDDAGVRADHLISLEFTDAGLLGSSDYDAGLAFGRARARELLKDQVWTFERA